MKFKFIALFVVVVLSTFTSIQAQNKSEVNSGEVNQMLQRDNKLIVLDVRSAEEFKEGHIKGAININILEPDALAKIDKLDHNARYIVHCRTNFRSKTAFDHMKQSGFKTVFLMKDGMKGWIQNKLPVVK
jgi:rhodanese-related sulfurtransferase